MMTSLSFSWPASNVLRVVNARVPAVVCNGLPGPIANAFRWTEFGIKDRTIVDARTLADDVPVVDLAGQIVLPGFHDIHTHLDKGHIWPRTPNRDGTFQSALEGARADREHWNADDLRARMDFALRGAYAHGTVMVRTHLDSFVEQTAITWPVASELRSKWSGKIELQLAALTSVDSIPTDDFISVARTTAEFGGILGTVAYSVPDLDERFDRFFQVAIEFGLEADFHADETQEPTSVSLRKIAEAKLRAGYDKPVLVGHCCSLARQMDKEAEETLDLVAKAGLNIVSLPMCNSYLQDRAPGRTPRSRGVTLVHEMKARGIPVAFASDNTRDPFYAYGDLDMLEVMREATRIAHLEHPIDVWPAAFASDAAKIVGLQTGWIQPGASADFSLYRAREWTELLARPHHDRIVVRAGQAIDTTLPNYAELDAIVGPPIGTPL